MPRASDWRRARFAALALALILAGGFIADTVVLVAARENVDSVDSRSQPNSAVHSDRTRPIESPRPASATAEPAHRPEIAWPARSTFWQRDPRSERGGGIDRWSLGMIGVTLVLAIGGGVAAVARRRSPQFSAAAVAVAGRVHLSPKHTVYLLRVGRRSLLVGTGPQGAPALIAELDEPTDLGQQTPPGEIP